MNQQAQPSPREHHFYVAIAKFLFHHPEHGIVSVRDPIKIKDAERYALENLRTIVVRTLYSCQTSNYRNQSSAGPHKQ